MVSRITQLFIGALAGVMFSVTAYAAQVQYPRIIGGSDVGAAYSWMVSIQVESTDEHFCGGTLIAPYWVLTAAHCVESADPRRIQAVIGARNLEMQSAETINIARIIIHEDYKDGFEVDNDIALLRLSSASINTPAPLISAEEMAILNADTNGLVLGWGETENGTPDILQEVELPIRTAAECRSVIPDVYDDGLLCAGLDSGGKDSCFGDSGGPLMIDISSELKHAGIVSFGYSDNCATPGTYGIYTRVAEYLDWIESKTNSIALVSSPDFGFVLPNITQTNTLQFVNFSPDTVILSTAEILGISASTFAIAGNNCVDSIPVNGQCTITLTATPTATGSEVSALLQIPTSSMTTPTINSEITITTLDIINTSDALYKQDLSFFTGGDQAWTTSGQGLDGSSLASGDIANNESSILAVNVSGISSLAVRIKVSSEEIYDGLEIVRDGTRYRFYSGELDWQLIEIPTNGVEVVEFIYRKDISLSEGSDRAWIESEELKDSGGGGGSLTTFSAVLLTLLALRRRSRHLRCH